MNMLSVIPQWGDTNPTQTLIFISLSFDKDILFAETLMVSMTIINHVFNLSWVLRSLVVPLSSPVNKQLLICLELILLLSF